MIRQTSSHIDDSALTPEDVADPKASTPSSYQSSSRKSQRLVKSKCSNQFLAWSSALLTIVFLILTSVYASRVTAPSHLRFLYSCSANTIFVLSILSGLTGLFLAATIASTFERVQWLLISRKGGLLLSRYLSLQAGTGVIGLLTLTVGRGHAWRSTVRLWSAIRLGSLVLVPIMGILIMSNVNTRMVFNILDEARCSRGWGMSLFNDSLANNVSAIADQLVQADLAMFLSERSRSVDITPTKLRLIPCSHVPGIPNTQNCKRSYFVPGGVELASVNDKSDSVRNKADVILAKKQRGYIFDFVEGPGIDEEWNFGAATECEVYGFPFGAFHLCLSNPENNTLRARIVHCPSPISALSNCHTNRTWYSRHGWTTSLTTHFRYADVAYSKSNGTILSHTFTSAAFAAPVSATAMLAGYRAAFSSFPTLTTLLTLLADPDATNLFSLYVYPAMIWANLKSVEALGPQNPAVVTRAQDTLQCLLAIMLFYCQPSLFARALAQYTTNATLGDAFPALKTFAEGLIRESPPDTEVVAAVTRYQLQVGRATLVAYVVICGVALGACVIALGWASWMEGSGKVAVPTTSPFPAWDERTKCQIEPERGTNSSTLGEDAGVGGPVSSEKGLASVAEGLRLVLVRNGIEKEVEVK